MSASSIAFAASPIIDNPVDEWDEFLFSDDDQGNARLGAKSLAALGASLLASALVLSGGLCALMAMPGLL